MKRYEVTPEARSSMIPEFCRMPAQLTLAYVMELLAVVLTLLGTQAGDTGIAALVRFLLLSLYLQWLGFCGAAVLCLARRWLRLARVSVVFFVCWGLLVLVTFAVSWSAWAVEAFLHLGIPIRASQAEFVIRNVCVGAILSLLVLRYFWERHQWLEETRAESEARYLALQARIRPHFLFNALNSLAELIRSKPETAEDMVVDLADLFRVSLDARQRLIPLREEIEIVKGYLRIEEIRLGDKLLVNWEIADNAQNAQIPRLTLQPLVENGVLHGVSRLRARGMLHVIARKDGDFLVVDVENPVPPEEAPKRAGTGTAVNNIAQRIKLIYGDKAKLIMGEDRDEFGPLFRARLRLPYVPHTASTATIVAVEEEEEP
jgi:two-component system sensor histidine kinase AlgZ